MSNFPEQLPEGYQFSIDFSAEEVINLRSASGWGTEKNVELWQRVIDESIASVGVKNGSKELVGIGFLAGNPRHAVLCDFNVHPSHQGLGIGRAILHRRINLADARQIPYLYTELAPTNTLRSHYEKLGFVATGNAYTRAARRHPSEIATTEH